MTYILVRTLGKASRDPLAQGLSQGSNQSFSEDPSHLSAWLGRDQLPGSLKRVLAVLFVSCWTAIHWLLAEGHSGSSATWASPQDRSQMTACLIRTRKLENPKPVWLSV